MKIVYEYTVLKIKIKGIKQKKTAERKEETTEIKLLKG